MLFTSCPPFLSPCRLRPRTLLTPNPHHTSPRPFLSQEAGPHEGRPHYDFVSLAKELLPPGALYDAITVPFHFRGVEKLHEVSEWTRDGWGWV